MRVSVQHLLLLCQLVLTSIRRVICWLHGLTDTISCIEVKKNIIVAGSCDGTICVWDLTKDTDNNALLTLKGHTGAVLCLKLHDNYLVSGGDDREARVWNIENGQCKHVLRGHEKGVRFVCMNDHAIVTASADTSNGGKSEIQVWLPGTGRFVAGYVDSDTSSFQDWKLTIIIVNASSRALVPIC